MILDALFFCAALLFLLVYIYLFFLAGASFLPERRRAGPVPPAKRFAIVIPAYNESASIEETLIGLREVDYPVSLYDVYVIADNCDDNTAELARRQGAMVFERHDPVRMNKGYALQWAFARLIEKKEYDVYAVVDADTRLNPDFLHCLNRRFQEGAKAVQAYTEVMEPLASGVASLSCLGFILNRNFRYRGRSKLGWTSNLMGTGMCFAREVIERFGWVATSIVEDIEYEMFLHLNDVRVVHASEARLKFHMHDDRRKTDKQRTRWDMGKFEVRNKYFGPLLLAGLKKRDLSYFDSALELLIPPYSLLVVSALLCFLLFLIFDYKGLTLNFYLWLAVIAMILIYTLGGLLLARVPLKFYLSLLYVPFFLAWRLWLVLSGALRRNRRQW
jgi:1,2-diacylglycerol 3-beta-glucosyltransferase